MLSMYMEAIHYTEHDLKPSVEVEIDRISKIIQ